MRSRSRERRNQAEQRRIFERKWRGESKAKGEADRERTRTANEELARQHKEELAEERQKLAAAEATIRELHEVADSLSGNLIEARATQQRRFAGTS